MRWTTVTLGAFDHFVKEHLRVRHYLRYIDDFLLLASDRREARERLTAVRAFLTEHLRLELNPRHAIVAPVGEPCDLLGYPHHAGWALSVASWFGLAKHAHAFRLSKRVFLQRDVDNLGKRLLVRSLWRALACRVRATVKMGVGSDSGRDVNRAPRRAVSSFLP